MSSARRPDPEPERTLRDRTRTARPIQPRVPDHPAAAATGIDPVAASSGRHRGHGRLHDRQQAVDNLLAADHANACTASALDGATTAQAGLNPIEARAVAVVHRVGRLTARELAEQMGLAPSTVTALVDRLTAKRVARRVPHPTDRRSLLIEIDPLHARRSTERAAAVTEPLRQLCEDYTDDQIAVLTQFLTAATRTRQQAIKHCEPDGVPAPPPP